MTGRRSTRAKPRKSYTNDPFAGIEDAIYASSDSGSSTTEVSESESEPEIVENVEEEDEDLDLGEDAAASEDDVPNDEEQMQEQECDAEGDPVVEVDYSDGELDEGSGEDGKGRSVRMSDGRVVKKRDLKPTGRNFLARGLRNDRSDRIRWRGISDMHRGVAKETRCIFLFGPSKEDLVPVFKTKNMWDGMVTLPSKDLGCVRTEFVSEEQWEKEKNQTKRWWFHNGGKEAFEKGQRNKQISRQEGKDYMIEVQEESNVLMGPIGNLKLFRFKTGSIISTAEPFSRKRNRRGWMLNLGAKVQDAQWVPNEGRRRQYLALAVQQRQTKGWQQNHMQQPEAPAFTEHKGFPASIQVWGFNSLNTGELDTEDAPRLELVICMDWGAIRSFKWCPIPTSETVDTLESESTIRLGLLAVIFTDGKVRLLDVEFPKMSHSFQPYFLHISCAAFEAKPPESVCSSMTWISGTSLAVGTSTGNVAVWTLTRPDMFPSHNARLASDRAQHEPFPWFYKVIADSYITSIVSAFPSHPFIISTTSVDGYSRLTDLRSPTHDTVSCPRIRTYTTTQLWHEQTQAFMSPDENYLMRSHSIRRFHSTIHSMRTDSPIQCAASSPVHPIVLLGGTDGICIAGNPIGRLWDAKEVPWQQIWFHHEWRRGINSEKPGEHTESKDEEPGTKTYGAIAEDVDEDGEIVEYVNGRPIAEPLRLFFETEITSLAPNTSAEEIKPTNSNNTFSHELLKKACARITEGYKPTKTTFASTRTGLPHEDTGKYATVYEEPAGITTLAWNPNLKYGTWAVAGMGDGLVRVEDLGVEDGLRVNDRRYTGNGSRGGKIKKSSRNFVVEDNEFNDDVETDDATL